jgi:hypothetical protein
MSALLVVPFVLLAGYLILAVIVAGAAWQRRTFEAIDADNARIGEDSLAGALADAVEDQDERIVSLSLAEGLLWPFLAWGAVRGRIDV